MHKNVVLHSSGDTYWLCWKRTSLGFHKHLELN